MASFVDLGKALPLDAWQTSVIYDYNLLVLCGAGLIQSKQLVGYRNAQGWHAAWFHCSNLAKSLPPFFGHATVARGSWSSLSTVEEMLQLNSLLNLIENLKTTGLTGVWATRHFIWHRIQPLKNQVRLTFDYTRSEDPTWEMVEVLQAEAIRARVGRLFMLGTEILVDASGLQSSFHARNAAPVDQHQFLSYHPSQASPVLKRALEEFTDEPADKSVAFDPDAELAAVPEDVDAPSPTRSLSPPPLKLLRKPVFRKGPRKSSDVDPTAPAGSGDTQPPAPATAIVLAASGPTFTPATNPVLDPVAKVIGTAIVAEPSVNPSSVSVPSRVPGHDKRSGVVVVRPSLAMAIEGVNTEAPARPTVAATPVVARPEARGRRADKVKADVLDDTHDIAEIKGRIEQSVRLLKEHVKALESGLQGEIADLQVEDVSHRPRIKDQAAALDESKKVNVTLQADCVSLLAAQACTKAECSKLSASKAVLEAECERLKNAGAAQVVLGTAQGLSTGPNAVDDKDVNRRMWELLARHTEEMREAAKMAASQVLAILKSLYPRIDLVVLPDGFAADCEPENALRLMKEA
uniref:Uncharacterized protein n=1 Tax=Oryza brachyantha TaxID=4533 RepID=J3KUJ4_ORYBR